MEPDRIEANEPPLPYRDRRRHPRYRADGEIRMQFLFPEETFSPHAVKALFIDVSLGGMRLKAPSFEKTLYVKLLSSHRHVKIGFEHPNSGEASTLEGKIVWIDYHQDKAADGRGECFFGIQLTNFDDPEAEAYRIFIDEAENASGPTEVV